MLKAVAECFVRNIAETRFIRSPTNMLKPWTAPAFRANLTVVARFVSRVGAGHHKFTAFYKIRMVGTNMVGFLCVAVPFIPTTANAAPYVFFSRPV